MSQANDNVNIGDEENIYKFDEDIGNADDNINENYENLFFDNFIEKMVNDRFDKKYRNLSERLQLKSDSLEVKDILEDSILNCTKNQISRERPSLNIIEEKCSSKIVAGIELRISDEENDPVIERKGQFEMQKARYQLSKFLSWAYDRYKEPDVQHDKKKKESVKIPVGNALRNHKLKYDFHYNNRIKSKPNDLPDVFSQSFLLTPFKDNNPSECFQVYNTNSAYLGTANVFGMNGHGTYVYPNGAVYTGHFKDNMLHGFGRIIYPNKTIVEGYWYRGELMEPKLYFADGVPFDPDDWNYLKYPDRRYLSEKNRGLLPDNDPQLTNDHPARALPEDCFDNGEGFYNTKTKYLQHPINGSYIRTPSATEAQWIIKNCRSDQDPNIPFMAHMFPAQYNISFQTSKLEMDHDWFCFNFPKIPPDIGQQIRSEIIGDLDEIKYNLTRETMAELCVPALRKDVPAVKSWFPIPKNRRIKDCYMTNLSMRKIIFPDFPCRNDDKKNTINSLQLLEKYSNEKFRLRNFIRNFKKIDDFVTNGTYVNWTIKLEGEFKHALHILRALDQAFIHLAITAKKSYFKKKLRKSYIINVIKLWLNEDIIDNTQIDDKDVQIYERKLEQYKKFVKNEVHNFENIHDTCGTFVKVNKPKNLAMTTINKLRKMKHLVTTNSVKRN